VSQVSYKLRVAALVVVVGVICLALAPQRVLRLVDDLLWLANTFLFLFCLAVLAWFVYRFILRRLLRARRIRNARLARLVRENIEQSRERVE